jgi:hypothetical protein
MNARFDKAMKGYEGKMLASKPQQLMNKTQNILN